MDLEDFELIESNVPDIRFGHINIYCSMTDKELLIMEKIRRSTSREDHAFSCMQAEERLKIQHDNILRMLWVDKDDSKWLANAYFEYPNEDLFDRQEKLKNPKELIQLLNDMLEAMAYLQRHKMVHGDFRPEYVFFSQTLEKYVLLDRLIDASPANQAQMNNIFYQDKALFMSPVMFDTLSRGKVKVKHNPFKSEVFALGMVIISLFVEEDEILKCYNRRTKSFDVQQFRRIEDYLKKSVFVGHIEDLIGEYLFLCVLNLDEKQRLTPKKALKILRKGVCQVLDSLDTQVAPVTDRANTVTQTSENGSRLMDRKPLEIDQLLTPSETTISVNIPSQTSNTFDLTGMPNMGKEVPQPKPSESPHTTDDGDKSPGKLHEILLNNSFSHTNNETFYGSGSHQTDGLAGLNDIYDPNVKKLKEFLRDDEGLVQSRETFGKPESFQNGPRALASPESEDKQFQSCQNFVGQESPEQLKKGPVYQSEKRRTIPFPECVPEEPEDIQESIFRGEPEADMLNEMQGSEYHINESDLGLKGGSDAENVVARGGSPVQSPPLTHLKMVPRPDQNGYFSYGPRDDEFRARGEATQRTESREPEDIYSLSTLKEARNLQSLRRDSLNIDFKANNLEYTNQRSLTSRAHTTSVSETHFTGRDPSIRDCRFPEKKSDFSVNLSSNSQQKSLSIRWARDHKGASGGQMDTFNRTDDASLTDTFDREMRQNVFSVKTNANEQMNKFAREHASLEVIKVSQTEISEDKMHTLGPDELGRTGQAEDEDEDEFQTGDLRRSISVDSDRPTQEYGDKSLTVSPVSLDFAESTMTRRETQNESDARAEESGERVQSAQNATYKRDQIRFIKCLISKRLRQMKKEVTENLRAKLAKSIKSISVKSQNWKQDLNSSSLSDTDKDHDLKVKNYAFSEKKVAAESGEKRDQFRYTSENPRRGPLYRPNLPSVFLETFGKDKLAQKRREKASFKDILIEPALIGEEAAPDQKGAKEETVQSGSSQNGIVSIDVYLSENEQLKVGEFVNEQNNLDTMEVIHLVERNQNEFVKEEQKNFQQHEPFSKEISEHREPTRSDLAVPPNSNLREVSAESCKSFEDKSIQTSSNYPKKPFKTEENKVSEVTSAEEQSDSGPALFRSNKEFDKESKTGQFKYSSEVTNGEPRRLKEHRSEPKRPLYEKKDTRSEETLSEDIYLSNNLMEAKGDGKKNLEEAILGPIRVEAESEEERPFSEHARVGARFNVGNQFGTISEASEDFESENSFLKDGKKQKKSRIFKTGSFTNPKSKEAPVEKGEDPEANGDKGAIEPEVKSEEGPEKSDQSNREAPETGEEAQTSMVKARQANAEKFLSADKQYQTDKTDNSNFKIGFEFKESENYTNTETVTRKSDAQSRIESQLFQLKNSEFPSPPMQILKGNVQKDMLLSKISEGAKGETQAKEKGGKLNQTEELHVTHSDFLRDQKGSFKINNSMQATLRSKKVSELEIQFCDISLRLERFRKKRTEVVESIGREEERPDEMPSAEGNGEGGDQPEQNTPGEAIPQEVDLVMQNLEIREIQGYFSGVQSRRDVDLGAEFETPGKFSLTNKRRERGGEGEGTQEDFRPESTNIKESLLRAKEYADESNFSSTGKQRFLVKMRVKNMIHDEMRRPEEPLMEEGEDDELIQHHLDEDYSDEELYITSEQCFPKERFSVKENKRFLVCSEQDMNLAVARKQLNEQVERLCEDFKDSESGDELEALIRFPGRTESDDTGHPERRESDPMLVQIENMRNEDHMREMMDLVEAEKDGLADSETEGGLDGRSAADDMEVGAGFEDEDRDEPGEFQSCASIKDGESNYSAINNVQRQSFYQLQRLKLSFEPEDQIEEEHGRDWHLVDLPQGQRDFESETSVKMKTFGNEFSDNEDGDAYEEEEEEGDSSSEDDQEMDIHRDLDEKTYLDETTERQTESYFNAEITITDCDVPITEDEVHVAQTVESRVTGLTGKASSGDRPNPMRELAGIHSTVSRFAKNHSETVNFTDQGSERVGDSKTDQYMQDFDAKEIGFRKSEPIGHHRLSPEKSHFAYEPDNQMEAYFGKLNESHFKKMQKSQAERGTLGDTAGKMSMDVGTSRECEDRHRQKYNEIVMAPREVASRESVERVEPRSVHDIIRHYSKKSDQFRTKHPRESNPQRKKARRAHMDGQPKSSQASSTRVVHVEKVSVKETTSTRTLKESCFKTEGISEPPSKSIILSRPNHQSKSRTVIEVDSTNQVVNEFKAQFESPILVNRKFGGAGHKRPGEQSAIPDTMVISQNLSQNRSSGLEKSKQQSLFNQPMQSRENRFSKFKQDIKYRAPVIRSRSRSSNISSNFAKKSGLTQDTRFSPKPSTPTGSDRLGNIFAQPLSKSIRMERHTQITRDSRRTDNSQRKSQNSRNDRKNQHMKDTLFTQPPLKRSSQFSEHSQRRAPLVEDTASAHRLSDEPLPFSSIKTQEKFVLKKNSVSQVHQSKPSLTVRTNESQISLPKCSIRISRSPSPHIGQSKPVVIEEKRFGLKIRRKSTDPVKPPHQRVLVAARPKIHRFKSPTQPSMFTFDKKLLQQTNLTKIDKISKDQRPNWSQHSKIRTVESKIMNERQSQMNQHSKVLSNKSQHLSRPEPPKMSNNSSINFSSRQHFSKISKVTENISSEMSYVVNTQNILSSSQNNQKHLPLQSPTQRQPENLVKAPSTGLSQRGLPTRSPSPRIIRKTIAPSQPHSTKNNAAPVQSSQQRGHVHPRPFDCKSFKPIIVGQSSRLSSQGSFQMKRSFQGWQGIAQDSSTRVNRFKSPVRVIQSLNRNESPFRTRKTKVIRIEHSRSVDRIPSSPGPRLLRRTNQSPGLVQSSKPEVPRRVIRTRTRDPTPIRASGTDCTQAKLTNSRFGEGGQSNVFSKLKTSRRLLETKQKTFRDHANEDSKLTTSTIIEDKSKKKGSKMGILDSKHEVLYQPGHLTRLQGMKSSRDGVNLVMYNTPSFDNVRFESNLSKLSKASMQRDLNSKNRRVFNN